MALDPITLARSLKALASGKTAKTAVVGGTVADQFMQGFSPQYAQARQFVPKPVERLANDAMAASGLVLAPGMTYLMQEALTPREISPMQDMTEQERLQRPFEQLDQAAQQMDDDEFVRRVAGRDLPRNSPRRLQILHSAAGGGSINELMLPQQGGSYRFAAGEPRFNQNPLGSGYGPGVVKRIKKLGY